MLSRRHAQHTFLNMTIRNDPAVVFKKAPPAMSTIPMNRGKVFTLSMRGVI
jgi:hypothetical protein